MKKKILKKTFSFVISLLMVVTMMPMSNSVFAADIDQNEAAAETDYRSEVSQEDAELINPESKARVASTYIL